MLTVTIDKAGRIVIPKRVRDELGLEPGDKLTLESQSDRVILRRSDSKAYLRKERGVWTLRGGQPLSLDEANQIVRATREPRGGQ